jgi:hypothetical protein
VKRKAARREVVLPAELMVYVLMCRTKITRDRNESQMPDGRDWRVRELTEWVGKKDERRQLSYAVSQRIRGVFDEQERRLREEERRHDELASIRDRICELGFNPGEAVSTWKVRERLDQFNATVDIGTLRRMRVVGDDLKRIAETLQEMKDGRRATEEDVA